MNQKPQTVSVFRAISGRFEFGDKKQIFDGITDAELRKRGVFTANFSPAQYQDSIDPFFEAARRVTGLPVFLSKEEAIFLCIGKRYKNQPAIVEVKIPIDDITEYSAKLVLIQNVLGNPKEDRTLTKDELINHLQGQRIRGECYLTSKEGSAIDEQFVRKNYHETFYRPILDTKGRIVQEKGFLEVAPPNFPEGEKRL